MENGMETNYFTTTEPQDSGTEFLLPLLLCWKIITDVRAHRKQLPVEHGKTQGHSCTVSNLLLRNPKAIQNNLSSYFHCVPNWQGYQLFVSSLCFSMDLTKYILPWAFWDNDVHLRQICSAAHDSDRTSTGQWPASSEASVLLSVSFLSISCLPSHLAFSSNWIIAPRGFAEKLEARKQGLDIRWENTREEIVFLLLCMMPPSRPVNCYLALAVQ